MKLTSDQIECHLVKAVQQAALAAYPWVGKGNSHAADCAATDAMRAQFSRAPFQIKVVIGEGERDASPMLFRGEILGEEAAAQASTPGQTFLFPLDCAVDPLEGTSLVESGRPGAISIAVLTEAGGLCGAPDFYMEKLAAPAAARGWVHLKQSPEERVRGLCQALGKVPEELCIAVQERPRHVKLVEALQNTGAKVHLFHEGDVTVALRIALSGTGFTLGSAEACPFDAFMGIGAAPEGVITAAAFECLGGFFQGRFAYDPSEVMSGLIGTCKETNYQKLVQSGIEDPDRHFDSSELAQAQKIFVALCGITHGDVVKGIENQSNGVRVSESLLLTSERKLPQLIRDVHPQI